MRTPFGRVSRASLPLLLAILGAIVAGLIVPGNTGTTIEVVAWFALFALVLIEVGPGTVGTRTRFSRDRRHPQDEEDADGWPYRRVRPKQTGSPLRFVG